MTFDEAGFRLVPVYRRVWFIKGEKPKGFFFWSNKKLSIFGALIDGKKLFLAKFNLMIKVEFLLPYSPELNSTETCWKIIRANVTNSTYFPNLESMQESIESFLDNHFLC